MVLILKMLKKNKKIISIDYSICMTLSPFMMPIFSKLDVWEIVVGGDYDFNIL